MRRSARNIVATWIAKNVSIIDVERCLELPFGSLEKLVVEEGPADPAIEILLNIVASYPWLLIIADNKFSIKETVKKVSIEWERATTCG